MCSLAQSTAWSSSTERLEVRLPAKPGESAHWRYFRAGHWSDLDNRIGLFLRAGHSVAVKVISPDREQSGYDLGRQDTNDSKTYRFALRTATDTFIDPAVLSMSGAPFHLAVLHAHSFTGDHKEEVASINVYKAQGWQPNWGIDIIGGAIQGETATFGFSPASFEFTPGVSIGAYVLTVPGPGLTFDPNDFSGDGDSGDNSQWPCKVELPQMTVGFGLGWHVPIGKPWNDNGDYKPIELTFVTGLRSIDNRLFDAVPFVGMGVRFGF